jgi:hypothetical protein
MVILQSIRLWVGLGFVLGRKVGEWPAALMFRVFQCLGAPSSWLSALEKKVQGGRNRPAVGSGVWAPGKAGRGSGCRRSGQVPSRGATSERLGEGKSLGFGGLSFLPGYRGSFAEARQPAVEAGETVERRRWHRCRSRAVEEPHWAAEAVGASIPDGLASGGGGGWLRRRRRPPKQDGGGGRRGRRILGSSGRTIESSGLREVDDEARKREESRDAILDHWIYIQRMGAMIDGK